MMGRKFILYFALPVLAALLNFSGCRSENILHSSSRQSFVFGSDAICEVKITPDVSSVWKADWTKLVSDLVRKLLEERSVETTGASNADVEIQYAIELSISLANQGSGPLPLLILSGQGMKYGAWANSGPVFSTFKVKTVVLRARSSDSEIFAKEVQADLRPALDELLDEYFQEYSQWMSRASVKF
jgi:hypothetical protein